MGIFDFLRKIVKTDNVGEIVIEKLAFSEVKEWINRKIEENELKKSLDKLRRSTIAVENDQFDKTETCRLIDNEIKKYSPQQGVKMH